VRFTPLVLVAFIVGACSAPVRDTDLAAEYYNIGNAYLELEEYDDAVRYYRQALRFDADAAKVSYNLSRALIESGDAAGAVEHLQQLLTRDPENLYVLQTLAYALYRQGDVEESLAAYRRILEHTPFHKDALFNIGVLLEESDRPEEAVTYFRRLEDMGSEDTEVRKRLGMLEADLGNHQEAIFYLYKYTESESKDTEALSVLADSYAEEELFADALDTYERLLAMDEKNGVALFEKAFILLTAVEDLQEGLDALDAAAKAGYRDPEAYRRLLEHEDMIGFASVRAFIEERNLLTEPEESDNEEASSEELEDS
jgi:tetratricopeptide (TPR) repeat protein